jgi:methylase of polypeptide subunit release factors
MDERPRTSCAAETAQTSHAAARYFIERLLCCPYVCQQTPPDVLHSHTVPLTATTPVIWETIFRRPLPDASQAQIFCAHQQPFALGIAPYRLYVSLWPTARGYFAEAPMEVAYATWLLQQRYQQVWTPAYGYGLKQQHLRFITPQQTLLDELITVFPGVYHPWHDRSSQAMLEAMAAEVQPGMRVYVVGLGCGIDARYAARRKALVRGVDINPLAIWNTRYLFATDAAATMLTLRLEDIRCASMFAALREGDRWCDRIFFNMPSTNASTYGLADWAVRDPDRYILQTFLTQSRQFLAPTGKIVFVHGDSAAVRHEAQMQALLLQESRASNNYPIFYLCGDERL